MKHFLTLTAMRIRLTLRNKMFLFFSVIMPFGFFFLYAGVFAKGDPQKVRFFLGPVISLAVMGSFWGLSAALVTFREQGILRRFHVTPVTAADMLASSIVANYILTLPTVIIELVFARVLFAGAVECHAGWTDRDLAGGIRVDQRSKYWLLC